MERSARAVAPNGYTAPMLERISSLKPLRVLVDRSRDAFHGQGIVDLRPERVFLTTDRRRRLSRRVLQGYDVLAIVSNGARPYSKTEREACREFVHRGGALLLAAGAGEFEAATGRTAKLGVNAIAALFGFRFGVAPGGPDVQGIRGYEPEDVEAGPHLRDLGLSRGDLWMMHTGPIDVPPGARVLLEAAGGEPVAAWARVGRGAVAAYGSTHPFTAFGGHVTPSFLVASLVGRRRAGGADPPGRGHGQHQHGPFSARLYGL